jgi:hypothetical protein
MLSGKVIEAILRVITWHKVSSGVAGG